MQINPPSSPLSFPMDEDKRVLQDHQDETKKSYRTFKRWTKEEDERLLRGIQQFGEQWRDIADAHFKKSSNPEFTRDAKSCASRYRYYWHNRYSIRKIQSVAAPIHVKISERKRQIGNVFEGSESESPKESKRAKKSRSDFTRLFPSAEVTNPSSSILNSFVYQPKSEKRDSPLPSTPSVSLTIEDDFWQQPFILSLFNSLEHMNMGNILGDLNNPNISS